MGHVDVAGVRYELPDGRVLLDDVSFRVGEGAKVALVGATAITMNGNEVIPNSVILIDRNRITYVGTGETIRYTNEFKVIDVTGKYIMPGMIDAHAHIGTGGNGIAPRTNAGFLASLAFGTTTMHDPSNETTMFFSTSAFARMRRSPSSLAPSFASFQRAAATCSVTTSGIPRALRHITSVTNRKPVPSHA